VQVGLDFGFKGTTEEFLALDPRVLITREGAERWLKWSYFDDEDRKTTTLSYFPGEAAAAETGDCKRVWNTPQLCAVALGKDYLTGYGSSAVIALKGDVVLYDPASGNSKVASADLMTKAAFDDTWFSVPKANGRRTNEVEKYSFAQFASSSGTRARCA